MRVLLDKTIFRRGDTRLFVAPGKRLYVLEAQDLLTRADGVDGSDPGELAAFLAGEEVASAYTTIAGGITHVQPLFSSGVGRFPFAYLDPGSYDLYTPDDPSEPLTRWEALSAQDLGGREIDYAAILSNFGTASDTPVNVTGLVITPVKTTRPLKIIFDAYGVVSSSATGALQVNIAKDGVNVKSAAISNINANNTGCSMHFEYVDRDDPGEYEYKITLQRITNGTATIVADGQNPCFIQAIEN